MPLAVHPSLIKYQSEIKYQSDRPTLGTRAAAMRQSVGRTLRLWRSRIRERHAFAVIDERELRDLGMSRWDMERELAKPFWRG